jgi:hypothetical protein
MWEKVDLGEKYAGRLTRTKGVGVSGRFRQIRTTRRQGVLAAPPWVEFQCPAEIFS